MESQSPSSDDLLAAAREDVALSGKSPSSAMAEAAREQTMPPTDARSRPLGAEAAAPTSSMSSTTAPHGDIIGSLAARPGTRAGGGAASTPPSAQSTRTEARSTSRVAGVPTPVPEHATSKPSRARRIWALLVAGFIVFSIVQANLDEITDAVNEVLSSPDSNTVPTANEPADNSAEATAPEVEEADTEPESSLPPATEDVCGEYKGVVCQGVFTDEPGATGDSGAIEAAILDVSRRRGSPLTIAIVADSRGDEPVDFAVAVANDWGVGDPVDENGVFILVSLAERRTEVVTQPKLELDGAAIAEAGDRFFAADDFDQGVLSLVRATDAALAAHEHGIDVLGCPPIWGSALLDFGSPEIRGVATVTWNGVEYDVPYEGTYVLEASPHWRFGFNFGFPQGTVRIEELGVPIYDGGQAVPFESDVIVTHGGRGSWRWEGTVNTFSQTATIESIDGTLCIDP